MMFVKRISLWLCIVFILCTLTGCKRLNGKLDDGVKNIFGLDDDFSVVSYSKLDKDINKTTKSVYKYLANDDSAALKKLFSAYIVENHDLDREINEFYDKIDGDIISVEKLTAYDVEGHSDANKGDVFNSYCGLIDNIKTNTGNSYYITIRGIYNYYGSEDKEGISYIFLMKPDELSYDKSIAQIGERVEYVEDEE